MNIEPGDYFVITRGQELTFALFGGEESKHYDHSHDDRIWIALTVCGPVIAARCVFQEMHMHWNDKLPVMQVNTNVVEVWPVTRKYVESFGVACGDTP